MYKTSLLGNTGPLEHGAGTVGGWRLQEGGQEKKKRQTPKQTNKTFKMPVTGREQRKMCPWGKKKERKVPAGGMEVKEKRKRETGLDLFIYLVAQGL